MGRAEQAALEESLFVETLRMGHRGRLQAFGWSMWPQIWPGDTVTLEPAPFVAPALAAGDMVLAMSGGCLRLHRVIARREGLVILKGDAVLAYDPAALPEQVLGRVVRVEGRGWAKRPLRGGCWWGQRSVARLSGWVGTVGMCFRLERL